MCCICFNLVFWFGACCVCRLRFLLTIRDSLRLFVFLSGRMQESASFGGNQRILKENLRMTADANYRHLLFHVGCKQVGRGVGCVLCSFGNAFQLEVTIRSYYLRSA